MTIYVEWPINYNGRQEKAVIKLFIVFRLVYNNPANDKNKLRSL
ncbi:hypothetical protein DCCM_2358 [Desulfocucumis palustris]|uniref:Uncharacterized protein n=1 Tax=Desulfocucumis palustris TaxID=1898651 RepID=A0A2L2XAF7_9FIRM|nr:hypothetical protein DCCM_2358 [Desulfocucumis palustris]